MSAQPSHPAGTVPIASRQPLNDTELAAAQLARLEALCEALPLAVAVFGDDLTLRRANVRFRDLTSHGNASVLAASIYDAFPNALADLSEQIDGAIHRRPSGPFRVAFQRGSAPRMVEASFVPIGAATTAARSVAFIASDVTEREELREKLARSVAQLEAIFDVIPESVRVYDAQGNITRSNTQAQRDYAAMAPRSLLELWQQDRPRSPDGVSMFMHEHPTARALAGESIRGAMIAVRRGGSGGGGPAADGTDAVLEVNSNPLRDAAGRIRGAVTVERDVTDRARLARQLEDQVRRSAQLYERVSTEAERLERMIQERTQEVLGLQEARSRERRLAAIGQLAAGVMHDVNNALNPIMAAAYLLNLHADDPVAVRDFAARIAQAAETGAATAARVGRFIRQEPVAESREESMDLSAIADEVIAMTRPLWAERTLGGHVALHRELAPGAIVRGIAGEVREALLNLVQNALDAMKGGGTLAIATRYCEVEVIIEVKDSGVGMSDEVRERAFEPFFSTKGAGGSGLGLSEVYGIMKRHRGRAELESVVGGGSVVRLVFPRASAAGNGDHGAPVACSPKRVLLVEDNADGREFMREILRSQGHMVDAVATVEDARIRLDFVDDALPYEVLLTDIGLPDGTGWDVVRAARARWPAIRVGVVTGWEPPTEPTADVHFMLRKPVRSTELLANVGADVA